MYNIQDIIDYYERIYTDDFIFLQYVWCKANLLWQCGIEYTTKEQFDGVRYYANERFTY